MGPITVRFTPTASDYVRVGLRLLLKRLGLRAFFPVVLVGAAFVCFIVNRSNVGNGETEVDLAQGSTYVLFLSLILLSLFLVVIFGIVPLLVTWRVRRQELLRSETIFRFSDEAVLVKDGFSELKQDWKNYQSVVETKEHYILVLTLDKNAGRFVPRRAFESPEQEATFRDLLKSKLKFNG